GISAQEFLLLSHRKSPPQERRGPPTRIGQRVIPSTSVVFAAPLLLPSFAALKQITLKLLQKALQISVFGPGNLSRFALEINPAVSVDQEPRSRRVRRCRGISILRVGNHPLRHWIEMKIRQRKTVLQSMGRKRSEEHTSELQSRFDLVCRLLLE